MAGILLLDFAFAGELALAVDAGGIGGVGFQIGLGHGAPAVEDVVGGDMDEEDAVGLGAGGEQGRAVAVDVPGLGDIGFGAVDGGVGGAVDDGVGLPEVEDAVHAGGFGDVEVGQVEGEHFVLGEHFAAIPAELAPATGDENLHGFSPADDRRQRARHSARRGSKTVLAWFRM